MWSLGRSTGARASTARRWPALLVIAAAACGDEPFVGQVSHSQFFEYHDQVQEPLCSMLLTALDRHADMIGGKVGLRLDASEPYRYYKFRDRAAFAADSGGCPPDNGACALGDAVYSSTFFHAHEQAHDYVFRAWDGWSNGLISEGEAVALSCLPFYTLQPTQKPTDIVGNLDWRDLVNLFGDSNEGYAAAGFFVTYLAEHYGWSSVEALHRRVPRGTSAETLQRAFSDVYPISIDDAWTAALGAPGAPPCQRDWQCMATAMAVGDIAAPDCDGEMHRSIAVAGQAGVVLSLLGDDARLLLQSCSGAAPTSYLLEGGHAGHTATHWASLPPGSYTMFPGPLPASVTMASYLPAPLVGSTCAAATTVSLDATGRTVVDLLPGAVNGWIHLAGGGRSYDMFSFNLVWNDLLTPGPISICTDCTATSCMPLPFGTTTRVVVGDQTVVRFTQVIASPPASTALAQLVFDASAN